jgi:hypothetical protein
VIFITHFLPLSSGFCIYKEHHNRVVVVIKGKLAVKGAFSVDCVSVETESSDQRLDAFFSCPLAQFH